ncbi:DUF1579 family protein [Cellulomonas sp.]|uniref:DUF1579 family protein n=1 Tax=Cellulomonas sp. TaxID=40001 RepID=UPI003BAA6F57
MSIVDHLTPLFGTWRGTNRLRLMPTDDYQASLATATIGVTAARFVSITYTWADGDAAQDGLLLIGGDATTDGCQAVWVDSWHTGPTWMSFSGGVGDDGELRLLGTYPAESGPDWGWNIHVRPQDATITMHNVVPGNAPYQVVELALEPDDLA